MAEILGEQWVLSLTGAMIALFLAGTVKGATGFALPVLAIGLMAMFLPPKIALAGMLLPTLVTNGLQAFRFGIGEADRMLRRYWRLNIVLLVIVALVAQLVIGIPDRLFFSILGLAVTAFALLQIAGVRLSIAPENRVVAQYVVGVIAGITGGLSGVWGPPVIMFFMAMDTEKREMATALGVNFFLGIVTLTIAHLYSGLLNAETLKFSAILTLAAIAGQQLGFRIQDKLDQKKFVALVRWVLLIAGLNLLRRAIF
ncbi:sulfite exporter TauE/SafE family protein [Paracoccaceae bacterium GXU_MW_L88]